MAKMTTSNVDSSLDNILVQLGDFGKYQIFVFSLVCVAVILHSAVHVAYVFTAMDLNYRCTIPKCDADMPEFEPSWLTNAVPYKGGTPQKCDMFEYINNSSEINDTCSSSIFNRNHTQRCSSFVYKGTEQSIVQEYDLQCDENLWKITMVGTINNVGQFFGLFVSGVISDKYGRRAVLVWGMILCAACGVIRIFMTTYEWFLVMEFLDGAFGSGTYICGFVLGVELVGPKKRVLTGVLASCCYAIGEIFTAGSAWLVKSWKPLILIIYTPSFLLLSYFWIVPESIRWNLSKGRIDEAKQTLRIVAKVNGKDLSENALEKLSLFKFEDPKKHQTPFLDALKSTKLMLRMINCCFCWITCTFLFYGLTLNSVSLDAGNSYMDFILTALVEIPAYIFCNYILDIFGRKKTLSASYLLTGAACIGFIFVPSDSHAGSLSIYLIGKFGATAAFTILYVLTSEMFPTNMRHSFMGTCSTFGRLGSMIAPQTPLLAQLWDPLPLLCFAAMSVIAGLLTLLFPETLHIKLPDTIEEAENISQLSLQIPTKEEENHVK